MEVQAIEKRQLRFSFTEIEQAFDRFEQWLEARELGKEKMEMFRLMYADEKNYYFKNNNTRNYIQVNKVPVEFNQ